MLSGEVAGHPTPWSRAQPRIWHVQKNPTMRTSPGPSSLPRASQGLTTTYVPLPRGHNAPGPALLLLFLLLPCPVRMNLSAVVCVDLGAKRWVERTGAESFTSSLRFRRQ